MPILPKIEPCDRRWSELIGDDRQRHCSRCDRIVYDLSALDREARESLLSGGARACVRLLSVAIVGAAVSMSARASPDADTPEETEAEPRAEAPVVPGEGPLPVPEQEILGALDRSSLERVIRSQIATLGARYEERRAARPGLAGKIVVRFVIEEGAVVEAEITSSALKDRPLEEAVLGYIRALHFPEHKARISVSYPLLFAPE